MTPVHPPRHAERLLSWALGPSQEASAILGDLAEDFSSTVAQRGRQIAARRYWREAVALSAVSIFGRAFGRPLVRQTHSGSEPMQERLSTVAFFQDARYALRATRRDPAFFLFATLIIGLGVGASTAVFSVVSPLLLQPLPFEDPAQLVLIENDGGGGGLSAITSRTSNVRDFREQARSFAGIGGYNAFFDQGSYNLVGSGDPERLVGVGVTHDLLDVLGVTPRAGRWFTAEEGLWFGDEAESEGVGAVILTHGFWTRRFGADPDVVGATIILNDLPREVVGVLPRSFDFSSVFAPTTPVDILVPWPISDQTDQWGNTTTMVARLRSGTGIEAAQSELDGLVRNLEEAQPDRWGLGAKVNGLQERIARPFRSGMLLLATAAGLVMLIVCVNLSNMLLARSPRRKREMAVRQTLGATRGRLVRQLLLESLLVSTAGAVAGVLLANAAVRFVAGTAGLDIPMLGSMSVDGRALVFTAGIALLAGVAVGLVPALQVAEGGEANALSGSSRGSSVGRGGRRLREFLVVTQVAMACVLLVFGGLVVRSFQQVMDVDLGFQAENAVAWQLSSARSFETLGEANTYYDEIVDAVVAVPGVTSVGLVDALPLGTSRTWGGRVVGKQYEEGEGESIFPHVVDRRYLPTMGIELLEGRHFTADDGTDAPSVIIVNETAARVMFPGGDAIGRLFAIAGGESEVVGVVADVKHQSLELSSDNEVYLPMSQVGDFSTLDMVVRSDLPATSIVVPVGAAIRQVDPAMPIEDYRSLDSLVDTAVSPRRFTLQILVAFGFSALLLAGMGIYGVLSYSVTERIPEIGIRMALGASAEEVRRDVVGKTIALAGVGVAIGVVVSLAGTRLISSLLYGVAPTDPLTFVVMIGILLAVALVSGFIPALRASRTDSAGALRSAG